MRHMTTEPTPQPQQTFGDLLRSWRLQQHLSQRAVGELLDPKAQPSTVSCWENGVRLPARKFLSQVLALTGIPAHLAIGPGAPKEP